MIQTTGYIIIATAIVILTAVAGAYILDYYLKVSGGPRHILEIRDVEVVRGPYGVDVRLVLSNKSDREVDVYRIDLVQNGSIVVSFEDNGQIDGLYGYVDLFGSSISPNEVIAVDPGETKVISVYHELPDNLLLGGDVLVNVYYYSPPNIGRDEHNYVSALTEVILREVEVG